MKYKENNMIVPIRIFAINADKEKQNELLGLEEEREIATTDLKFKSEQLSYYWCAEVGEDIHFSVGGTEFTTPYDEDMLGLFENIIYTKDEERRS